MSDICTYCVFTLYGRDNIRLYYTYILLLFVIFEATENKQTAKWLQVKLQDEHLLMRSQQTKRQNSWKSVAI